MARHSGLLVSLTVGGEDIAGSAVTERYPLDCCVCGAPESAGGEDLLYLGEGNYCAACWAAEQKGSDMTRDLRLMAAAAEEIMHLRIRVQELEEYQNHTERMLALFEAKPQGEGMVTEGEDIAWTLRQRIADAADKLEVPTGPVAEDPCSPGRET